MERSGDEEDRLRRRERTVEEGSATRRERDGDRVRALMMRRVVDCQRRRGEGSPDRPAQGPPANRLLSISNLIR